MKTTLVSIVAAICGVFSGAAFAQAPANDNFANAQSISGGVGSVNGNNFNATMQGGEPNVINYFGTPYSLNSSVWHAWTAPRTGNVTFNNGFQCFIGAYTGTAVNNLTTVSQSYGEISFAATAGTIYRIQNTGYFGGNEAAFALTWDLPNPNGTLSFNPSAVDVDETAGTVTLTVERVGGTTGTVGASYSTSAGSAAAGSDYTTTSSTVSFGPGVSSQTFTVPILEDPTVETPETFTVTLNTPTGGADLGAAATATVTIIGDEARGVLNFENTFVGVLEPEGPAVLTVRRTGGATGPLSVNYTTATDGGGFAPATPGSDFTTTSGTLNFANAQTSATINVPIINDPNYEPDQETFLVRLSNPSVPGALGGDFEATVAIESEDKIPGDDFASPLAITGATGSRDASDEGATSEGPYEDDFGVGVIWFGWTAPTTGVVRFTVPEDFGHFVDIFRGTTYGNKVAMSGPSYGLTATAAVTAGVTYHIAVGGGGTDFTLSWATTTNGVLSLAGFQNFIDPGLLEPSIRFVADEKGGNLTITVRRTGGLDGTVSAIYTVSEDTEGVFGFPSSATAGDDFTASTGTVMFLAGQAEKTITVPILNDPDQEDTEGFVVTLSNATGGALLGTALVQVNIFDDEFDPANDDFANAQQIFGVFGTVAPDNTLADPEATEPAITSGSGATLWYRWTPPVGGAAEFIADPNGSPENWVVDVFTASASGLQLVASAYTSFDEFGDPFQVRATFEAVTGRATMCVWTTSRVARAARRN